MTKSATIPGATSEYSDAYLERLLDAVLAVKVSKRTYKPRPRPRKPISRRCPHCKGLADTSVDIEAVQTVRGEVRSVFIHEQCIEALRRVCDVREVE